MTETTAVPLEIPTEARVEFAEQQRLPPPNSSAVDWDEVDRDLRAFSAPVVAAELRRLAVKLGGYAAPTLRRRADELSPPS
jgi:hypothetical protein